MLMKKGMFVYVFIGIGVLCNIVTYLSISERDYNFFKQNYYIQYKLKNLKSIVFEAEISIVK